jgi:hypothetical protein
MTRKCKLGPLGKNHVHHFERKSGMRRSVIAGDISCHRGCIESRDPKEACKKWTKPEDYMQPVDA